MHQLLTQTQTQTSPVCPTSKLIYVGLNAIRWDLRVNTKVLDFCSSNRNHALNGLQMIWQWIQDKRHGGYSVLSLLCGACTGHKYEMKARRNTSFPKFDCMCISDTIVYLGLIEIYIGIKSKKQLKQIQIKVCYCLSDPPNKMMTFLKTLWWTWERKTLLHSSFSVLYMGGRDNQLFPTSLMHMKSLKFPLLFSCPEQLNQFFKGGSFKGGSVTR